MASKKETVKDETTKKEAAKSPANEKKKQTKNTPPKTEISTSPKKDKSAAKAADKAVGEGKLIGLVKPDVRSKGPAENLTKEEIAEREEEYQQLVRPLPYSAASELYGPVIPDQSLNDRSDRLSTKTFTKNIRELSVEFIFPECLTEDKVWPETHLRVKLVREYSESYAVYISSPFLDKGASRTQVETVCGIDPFNMFKRIVRVKQINHIIQTTEARMLPIQMLCILSDNDTFESMLDKFNTDSVSGPLKVILEANSKLFDLKDRCKRLGAKNVDLVVERGNGFTSFEMVTPEDWIAVINDLPRGLSLSDDAVSKNFMKVLLTEAQRVTMQKSQNFPICRKPEEGEARLYVGRDTRRVCVKDDNQLVAEGYASEWKRSWYGQQFSIFVEH